MPDIINKRSPAKWDKRTEGKPSFLEGVHGADAEGKIKPATLIADEKAFLERRKVELADLVNGAGREALTDDDKWLNMQFRDERFHGDNLTIAGLTQDAKQIQFHGEATARALRNLGRFQEAYMMARSLPDPLTDSVFALLQSCNEWEQAVVAGDIDCGCERETQTYTDKTRTQRLADGSTGHPTVAITPNRRHRAERVALGGVVRWLYRCSICGGLSFPDEMPERHQAVHSTRAHAGEVRVTDAELLK